MVPSAFLSYSWDDDTHKEWVRALAKRLRADGVDVTLDRWATVPGDQLPAFMERAIRHNQFSVIVCTPRYKSRSDAREGGVGYEGDIMTAEGLTRQNNGKFIPVLRSGSWLQAAPSWLAGKYYINLSGDPCSERDYEDLVRTLLGIRETAPPIGKPMATVETNPQHKALLRTGSPAKRPGHRNPKTLPEYGLGLNSQSRTSADETASLCKARELLLDHYRANHNVISFVLGILSTTEFLSDNSSEAWRIYISRAPREQLRTVVSLLRYNFDDPILLDEVGGLVGTRNGEHEL